MGASDTVGNVIEIGLEEELSKSYGRYAHTIILERAIPDVRDGLKPVQRRILYAMAQSRNTPDNPYRKSAKTVGDVMGNYHPHGDQSIYDALVRLAQTWKMRLPHVDGHGNFGSIDDDPPAAMRYTEARLAGIAMELMHDIEKETVAFRPNFDESTVEPVVLPAGFPNLLVNGTSGVSTGFATDIPPHNLREVVEAACLRIESPSSTLDEVMAVLPGPDFPTGGILMGREGLREAYETGKGRVQIRARHEVMKGEGGRTLLVVSEIPYGVVKANLVRDLEQLRQNRAVQGISDIRDESDREGLRVVIELGRGADAEGVWNYLLKKTSLQTSYSFNMVAIANHRPEELGLLQLLDAYIEHRKEVIRARSRFDLRRAQERLHVVEGLIKALDILDEVIATIRASKDRADAQRNLVAEFGFTEAQADAILTLRLYRLTNLQITALREEHEELVGRINELEALLASPRRLSTVLKRELRDVAKRFGDDRRTEIRDEVETIEVKLEVRVKPQTVMVAVSDRGYIKRSSLQSYQATGASHESSGVVPGDFTRFMLETNTTHRVLVFSASGTVFSIPVHSIPEARWGEQGVALVNVVPFELQSDKVVAVMAPVAYPEDRHLLFVTKNGFVKLTSLSEFDLSRSVGVVACKLLEKDQVVAVAAARLGADVMLATKKGQTIRFPVDQVSLQGRAARGVRGMGVDYGDGVVSAFLAPAGESVRGDIVTFTEGSKAKRTPLSEYPAQHRGGKGVRTIIHRNRKPHVTLRVALALEEAEEFLVICEGAEPTRVAVGEIPSTRRDGNGFQLPRIAEGTRVLATLALGAPAPDEAGEPEDGEGAPQDTDSEPSAEAAQETAVDETGQDEDREGDEQLRLTLDD